MSTNVLRELLDAEDELAVFCITDHPDRSPTWVRCGGARLNLDGSINVRLDVLPLNGRLHLRTTGSRPETNRRAPSPALPQQLHS